MDRPTRVLIGLTLTTSAATAPACGGGQRGPEPTLRADGLPLDTGGALDVVGARFLSPMHVELRLTRPVASVDSIDPSLFRLSAAMGQQTTYRYTYSNTTRSYGSTSYEEIASVQCRYRGDNRYGYAGYAYDYTCYESGPVRVVALSIPANEMDAVVLTLSPPVDTEFLANLCDGSFEERRCLHYDYGGLYAYSQSETICDAGLFVHYAGGENGLTAQDGTPLEAMAGDWAERESTMYDSDYRSEYFPDMDLQRAIRCTPGVGQ